MSRPCDDMRDMMVDLTLGILNEEQRRDVQTHVDACESCRRYMQALEDESEALIALGQTVQADMGARQTKMIETLQTVAPAKPKVLPFVGGFVRTAVAAVLMLGAGIVVGRLTSPRPVDVEQLRAELQTSIVASLQPTLREGVQADVEQLGSDLQSSLTASLQSAVRESVRADSVQLRTDLRSSVAARVEPMLRERVLADVDERLASALAASEERVATEVVEQVREDLRVITTELMASSQGLLDQRFSEVVQLIEAARQTDRRQVARALEQIKTQTGMGLLRLAARTEETAPVRQKQ